MEKVLYVIPIIIFFMPLKELVMAERLNKHLKEKSDRFRITEYTAKKKKCSKGNEKKPIRND